MIVYPEGEGKVEMVGRNEKGWALDGVLSRDSPEILETIFLLVLRVP